MASRKRSVATPPPAAASDSLHSEVSADPYRVAAAAGALQAVLKQQEARSIPELIQLAYTYAEGGCELVQAICRTKKTFYSAGFTAQIKKTGGKDSEAMNDRINALMDEQDIAHVVRDLIWDQVVSDNSILVWIIDKGNVSNVMAVPPGRCTFSNQSGLEILKIKLDDDVVKEIRSQYQKESGKAKADQKLRYPQKYIDAALQGKDVELSNKDGEFWVVESNCRKFSGLAKPSMHAVFNDILLREVMISGDWAAAMFMQNVIQHVKVGETVPSGPFAGKRDYPVKEAIRLLQEQFKGPSKARRIYTDHTAVIQLLFPDPKVFSPEKFRKAEERLLRWGGVIDIMMAGGGTDGGFSQGYLGKSRFEAEGREIREMIGRMLRKFFMHPEVMAALGIPKGSVSQTQNGKIKPRTIDVSVGWDEQALKEWRQIHDALRMQLDYGGIDWTTVHELLGNNHELIRQRKTDEAAESELWRPLFEPRQGLLQPEPDPEDPSTSPPSSPLPGKAGRPAEKATEPEPPKPSHSGLASELADKGREMVLNLTINNKKRRDIRAKRDENGTLTGFEVEDV